MARRIPVAAWMGMLWVVTAVACTGERNAASPDASGPSYAQECSQCHGGPDSPAPPVDLRGGSDAASRGVGAHAAHLVSNTLGADIACADCHVVPAVVDAPGHIGDSLPAEVTFGGLARANGAQPTVDAAGAGRTDLVTCRNAYCHGATLAGGTARDPAWNDADPARFATCDACHGNPPPRTAAGLPHPQSPKCGKCHLDAAPDGGAITDRARHVDGKVDVVDPGCAACHGSPASPAPPVDTLGHTDVASRGVGVHQAHLAALDHLAAPVACEECHQVPSWSGANGHLDGAVGVRFGALSGTDGAQPAFDSGTLACTNTYCHGATLKGGLQTPPVWNQADPARIACSACHGFPPPAPHPAVDKCSMCHSTASAEGGIAHPAQHVDGKLQVAGGTGCSDCHGNVDNAAPPVDTLGRSDTALASVGAHQSHLKATLGLSSPVLCSDCHKVPASVSDAGHGDGTVQVTFSGLAKADGASPAFDGATATCVNAYCHGATLAGGKVAAPKWTVVDGTQAACDSCHGFPPPAPHVANDQCAQCHTDTVDAQNHIAHPDKHIDGTVEVAAVGCTGCHGTAGVNAAPPKDTLGRSDTTLASVGAHQAHLQAGAGISGPVPCGDCHKVPATVGDAGHIDNDVQVAFGGIATADQAKPAWAPDTASCAGTYCHGATLGGGTMTAPRWTKVDGTQVQCGSCHSLPPPPPHVASTQCGLCHGETLNLDGTFKDKTKHVDGTVEVGALQGCTSCHGTPGVNAAPPVDTHGRSDTGLVSVGAHQAHLGSAITTAVACQECHVVPATVDAAGHIDDAATVSFGGPLANAKGAAPSWTEASATCSGTYCHGATLAAGGAATVPLWTKVDGTQAQCSACHAFPPPAPHPANTACGNCHTETLNPDGTFKDKSKHIDGQVEVLSTLGCNSCHGNVVNAAPPVDTRGRSDTTLVSVGAHQAHLKSPITTPVACGECHLVPQAATDAGHDDGTVQVSFGSLSKTAGAAPIWTEASATCSGTYCHGTTLDAGGAATTPLWTKVDGTQAQCSACHAFPPPLPHVQNKACGNCHTATLNPDGTFKDKSKHVDGQVEVSALSCTSCHGTPGVNAAPPTDTAGNSASTFLTVGAHQAHVQAKSAIASPLACTECHLVPASIDAPGHQDGTPGGDVNFGTLAKTGGSAATWTGATGACATTYCHGAKLAGGTVKTPTWNVVDGTQDRCGACHGIAPATGRHSMHVGGFGYGCEQCHQGVASGSSAATGAITGPSLHVNGTVTVKLLQGGTYTTSTRYCAPTCHGTDPGPEYW